MEFPGQLLSGFSVTQTVNILGMWRFSMTKHIAKYISSGNNYLCAL